jgi:hypothetical protein
MQILSPYWQARIRDWYWTSANVAVGAGMASNFRSVLAAELRERLKPPPTPRPYTRDCLVRPEQFIKPKPTRSMPVAAYEESIAEVSQDADSDAEMQRIWRLLPKHSREVLTLTFADVVPREQFQARLRFGPWGVLAHLTLEAQEAHAREVRRHGLKASLETWLDLLGRKVEGETLTRGRRELVREIVRGCEVVLLQVCDRFMDAAKQVRRGAA